MKSWSFPSLIGDVRRRKFHSHFYDFSSSASFWTRSAIVEFPFPFELNCASSSDSIRDIFLQFRISRRSIHHLNKSNDFVSDFSLAAKLVYYLFSRIYLACREINFQRLSLSHIKFIEIVYQARNIIKRL